METRTGAERQSEESETHEWPEWSQVSRLAGSSRPDQFSGKSSLPSEVLRCSFAARPRRLRALALPPHPEPQPLRPRPSSLLTQDISHLLTRVFRNLYSVEVIGEDVSASLIQARGSENARHEEFVDQLQQIREHYKQRLDEVEMLERHITQARARALAETERAFNLVQTHVLETSTQLPAVKTVFRWFIDSELLQKHHLICPEDYYSDTVPFCSAPKGTFHPRYSKLTFSCEKRAIPKAELDKKLAVSCREKLPAFEDDFDHTVDSLTWDSTPAAKQRAREAIKKPSPPKNKKWMNHLRVSQRELDRRQLARMESRNHFLKNPRFLPPNTAHGGRSLIFPPKKPELTGEFPNGEPEQSCANTPVFLPKPSIVFFTDYEVGLVYEMKITLQNTTASSRYLRVLPPSTPYFALGLGMFPGKGGMVAPGMTCQYTVQFIPDCLGDFDDFILVETQSDQKLLIPLQARRPPPVLTLSPVLDCGYCLIGGIKVTKFICKNVGFSTGKFYIMPKEIWPPISLRAAASTGFVGRPPFGIMPSRFELAPGDSVFLEVLFLPTSLGRTEQTFIILCDNCQIKELVIAGTGQLVALDLIYVSGEKSQPDPGELTDLTAQYFIRFESENLQSTSRKQLIIRNSTHVELVFRWQIMKPNLKPLMPGETYSLNSIKHHPDRETAFSIKPEKGVLGPHTDHEFILSFSPYELRGFHSVLQMVLEDIPKPVSSEVENQADYLYSADDLIVLEVEVKGSAEPFQVLLEPYALIIPGENYIGVNVKKDFKMWNNSKSPIRYMWKKISDCHIIEVEPCTGVIEPNEVGNFELNFTGGVPGPASQDLLCEIRHSPSPVVLHIEAAFKGPALVVNISALQFGLLRLRQKARNSIQIQNVSQLPAVWHLRESPVCLEERHESVSPFDIEPSSGQLQPLGECTVTVTLEAVHCQSLQTVLELEVENGDWSYVAVCAEIQEPHVYLQNSQVELSSLYLDVPTKSTLSLVNSTLLPTRFHWGKLLGNQAASCTVTVSPRRGLLGPSEEHQFVLEFTAHTQDKLTNLALPCYVSGMKKPLVLGISGKPQGLQVTVAISAEGSDSSVCSAKQWPGHPEELHLDFGSMVPLRTCVNRQLILNNHSPVQTSFTLKFEYFGSSPNSLSKRSSLSDLPPALLKTARMREHLAKREQLDFMENMLSHGKGAAFFPHVSQGKLRAYQKLSIKITACANMWGEYWDSLVCMVGNLPPAVIPVHMAAVGCPISSLRTTYYTTDCLQKEPVIRLGTHISGGDTIRRTIRLYNSSPCDIRLDWETYVPEDKADKLVELRVFYGPPFPLKDQAGNEIVCPEKPKNSSLLGLLSPSSVSEVSHATAPLVEGQSSASDGATEHIISVILQEHEGVPAHHLFSVSPKQMVSQAGLGEASWSLHWPPTGHRSVLRLLCLCQVVPAGGSSTICISFSPIVLIPDTLHKVACTGYILGYMSLDNKEERDIPGQRHRLQDFAVGPLRLNLHGFVRRAQLSVELDDSSSVEFRCQASDLIPDQPCAGVNVSFSLSLELISYQKLPADQMLPRVNIQQSSSGKKEMVFTQDLLLEFPNQTTQVVPLRAIVAVPELQLSTSWVDFGTCFVNQLRSREVDLLNLSGCRSYWAVLMGQQEPDKEAKAFGVFPSSGLLEARTTNAPPTSITLQVSFTPRYSLSWTPFNDQRLRAPAQALLTSPSCCRRSTELYESTLVVEGMLGEKTCTLRLRGQGSYDEKYMASH
ncbi:deleted in lung and esophageal cancer protein 1 isoform X9 [Cavia porcellus]|uniref:deleted in lung and esophageal cancer protein 1 isoform X9 n=1 Tax=Cavia porcellus TaxID=10141 RepID=UPI002FE3467A